MSFVSCTGVHVFQIISTSKGLQYENGSSRKWYFSWWNMTLTTYILNIWIENCIPCCMTLIQKLGILCLLNYERAKTGHKSHFYSNLTNCSHIVKQGPWISVTIACLVPEFMYINLTCIWQKTHIWQDFYGQWVLWRDEIVPNLMNIIQVRMLELPFVVIIADSICIDTTSVIGKIYTKGKCNILTCIEYSWDMVIYAQIWSCFPN